MSSSNRKIPKLIDKYGLSGVSDKMVHMWTHPDESERLTLKEIRDHFNQQILRNAMEKEDIDPVAGEVEYGYMYLVDDDANHADRQDFKNRLQRNGVSVDEVTDDFINSPTTVFNYLRDAKDAEHPSTSRQSSGVDRDRLLQRFQRMRSRFENVSMDAIESLQTAEEIPDHEFSTSIEFVVTDQENGNTIYLEDLIQEGLPDKTEAEESTRDNSIEQAI